MDAKDAYRKPNEARRTLDVVVGVDGVALDITAAGCAGVGASAHAEPGGRRWIGVHFECCGVYTRVYRAAAANRYEGRCPNCGSPVTVRVSPEGVSTSLIRARVV